VALRTQQIIAYESGAPNSIDPLGGSYFIERLTNEIEARALQYLEKIDSIGGMVRALERGYVQQEIQNAAYDYQRRVDQGEAIVVGVNRFTMEEEEPIPIQRIDEALERKQVDRLRELRARRDREKWRRALTEIETAAQSDHNLMPGILQAVESLATVGEISDTLRRVFGEYRETVVV